MVNNEISKFNKGTQNVTMTTGIQKQTQETDDEF